MFNASKEKFLPGSAFASTLGKKVSETMHIRIGLEPKVEEIGETVYLGEMPSLSNIYFDFDKWNIRRDSKTQLDNIFERLLNNPDMTLEIAAHADSRGTDNYNMILSKKRAISVMKYLTDRGISKDRLNIKWFGESQPVNECVDGVRCSPAKHQQNRRAEFKPIRNHGFSPHPAN